MPSLSCHEPVAPVRAQDILCGRGPIAYNHPGNCIMRQKVKNLIPSYNNARKGQGPSQKGGIVRSVYSVLLKESQELGLDPPRFLECNNSKLPTRVLTKEEAISKIQKRFKDQKSGGRRETDESKCMFPPTKCDSLAAYFQLRPKDSQEPVNKTLPSHNIDLDSKTTTLTEDESKSTIDQHRQEDKLSSSSTDVIEISTSPDLDSETTKLTEDESISPLDKHRQEDERSSGSSIEVSTPPDLDSETTESTEDESMCTLDKHRQEDERSSELTEDESMSTVDNHREEDKLGSGSSDVIEISTQRNSEASCSAGGSIQGIICTALGNDWEALMEDVISDKQDETVCSFSCYEFELPTTGESGRIDRPKSKYAIELGNTFVSESEDSESFISSVNSIILNEEDEAFVGLFVSSL